ncbi:MAG: hypothetical protein A3E84_04290 [Gammaproteobacteria bacterium RIFCSPHIGHO2_12_FULL_42_13]|nr:MAG: hypothetical protein A3E84_04290 [Gammaproteobacteria bacterium RIFCSPHIGHO2_12_FULL_42_13]
MDKKPEPLKEALSPKQKKALLFSALLIVLWEVEYSPWGVFPHLTNFITFFDTIFLSQAVVNTLNIVIIAITAILVVGFFRTKEMSWGIALMVLDVLVHCITGNTHIHTVAPILSGVPLTGLFLVWLRFLF